MCDDASNGGFFLETEMRKETHYVAEFYDETRMTYMLSQVHSLSKIMHRAAKNFCQTSLRPST